MFVDAVLVYPVVLGLLCLGAGLLVDRSAGGRLPAMVLPAVGAALLIGVSQWTTYVTALAPGTPFALVGVAAAGFLAGRGRVRELAAGGRRHGWPAASLVLGYLVAAAPLVLAGRVTFTSYNVLPDSALHLIGADYLISHGQHYAHLDPRNSYGRYLQGYFGTNAYPSGAHTLFGGSAFLLPTPLIWTLEPFCAFMLAVAVGPAWVLVRRLGLSGGWAALAAVTVSMPALVYGYALVASIKELVALPMILTLGALVVAGRGSAGRSPTGALPFALVAAAGVSAIGVAFGAWALAGALILAPLLLGDVRSGRRSVAAVGLFVAAGGLVGLAAAWPTWTQLGGSLRAATAIAATSNSGNLFAALHPEQALGTWLVGSYSLVPTGPVSHRLTEVLMWVTAVAAGLGGLQLIRARAYVLAGWLAAGLAVWLGLTAYGHTWTDAKIIMLTSPVVLLLAWGGVAGLRASALARLAPLVALAVGGGVLASDALQYRGTDLAPTARYLELSSLDGRFGGGPTLVTDFDESSLYALRRMDVGGPDFVDRPLGLETIAPNHGDRVDLDLIPPAALAAYPLIVTGRDPSESRPPWAYRLIWHGTYYQVWQRRPGARPALVHVGRAPVPLSCTRIGFLALRAKVAGARLVSAAAPETIPIHLASALHPRWPATTDPRLGLAMTPHGWLRATFRTAHAGRWSLWIQGEIMPSVSVAVDGHGLRSVGGQVRGSVFNPGTLPPIRVVLAAGTHTLTLARGGTSLAPGARGTAVLHALFLTPSPARQTLRITPPARWRTLCGRRLEWVEVT
ncbi:MAG TPA: hypothetical protein VFR49_13585 [Solirubrobacteraceae bacterium]|nr:hypothetical protein [Solirubrobacteraceae bacterium]